MKLIKCIITGSVFVLISSSSFAAKKSSNPQIINFDGIDVNTSKGSPRDAFISTKKKADFGYFFNTKMTFKEKIIDSIERVR